MRTAWQNYLRKVCGFIKNSKKRKSTYKELRSHILDKIDYQVEHGLSFEIAEEKVLRDMPQAHWYGYKLHRAQRPFWRRHLLSVIGAFFLCIGSILAIVCVILVQTYYLPLFDRITQADQKYIHLFKKDLILVKDNTFFISKKEKPANLYLYKVHKDKFLDKNTNSLHKINQQLVSFSRIDFKDNSSFVKKMKEVPLDTIPTDWLEGLKDYDSVYNLTPEDQKRLAGASKKTMIKRISAYASTHGALYVSELSRYMKIRALKMCFKGQCKNAMLEMEHISKLIYSSESIVGHAVAVHLLQNQKLFIEKFKVDHKPPLSQEVLMAYRRLSWGWRSVQDKILKEPSDFDNLKPYFKSSTGFCSQVAERPLGEINAFSDFFEERWFLEYDFSQRIARERIIMADWHRLCGFKDYIPLLNKPIEYDPLFASENAQLWAMGGLNYSDWKIPYPNVMHIPYLRQVWGFRLGVFAVPDFLGPYRELEEQQRKNASGSSSALSDEILRYAQDDGAN